MKCLICDDVCQHVDFVDMISKTYQAMGYPKSGTMIEYVKCTNCGFIFAPEFQEWTFEDFSSKIYNEDYYLKYDLGYKEERPRTGSQFMMNTFTRDIKHLDYGGGHGYMVNILKQNGYDSTSYDPFVNKELPVGTFDVITAFEVFEHVPDPKSLMPMLKSFMHADSVVLFGVDPNDDKLAEGKALDEWWYVLPRGGHISLHSIKSLEVLAKKFSLTLTYAFGMMVLHYGHNLPVSILQRCK